MLTVKGEHLHDVIHLLQRTRVRFTNDVIFHVTTVNFSPLKTLPKNVALFMDIGETIIATGGFWGTQTGFQGLQPAL